MSNRASRTSALGLIPFAADCDPVLDEIWLIEDVLPEEGLGIGYGAPGTGKTFMAIDLAATIAGASSAWRGHSVRHGSVLYFGMEGGPAFGNRIAAFSRVNGPAPHFYRSSQALDLHSNGNDADAVIDEARTIAKHGLPVRLIIVDTLNRAMSGGDENSSRDMGVFIRYCEYIRRELGCFVLVIHHSGKDAGRGPRGHTALLGAVDTAFHFERRGSSYTMTVNKQRDGRADEQFGYVLRAVELGETERGKPITSCVVDEYGVTRKPASLTKSEETALNVLLGLISEAGVEKIHRDDFRTRLKATLTHADLDTRRKTANRAIDGAIKKGVIQVEGHFVSIVGTSPRRDSRTRPDNVRTCPVPCTARQPDRTGHTPIGVSDCPVSDASTASASSYTPGAAA